MTALVAENDLIDVWRKFQPTIRQYNWINVSDDIVKAAHLDRFYVDQIQDNSLVKQTSLQLISQIEIEKYFIHPPVGEIHQDHHLVTIDISSIVPLQLYLCWHFNTRLLQNEDFCRSFSDFWIRWKLRKKDFINFSQWWEIGKNQVKNFCTL